MIRTYFKVTGPDGYYVTDGIGNDLEFDTKDEAEDYIGETAYTNDEDPSKYDVEEFSNVDIVKTERWSMNH